MEGGYALQVNLSLQCQFYSRRIKNTFSNQIKINKIHKLISWSWCRCCSLFDFSYKNHFWGLFWHLNLFAHPQYANLLDHIFYPHWLKADQCLKKKKEKPPKMYLLSGWSMYSFLYWPGERTKRRWRLRRLRDYLVWKYYSRFLPYLQRAFRKVRQFFDRNTETQERQILHYRSLGALRAPTSSWRPFGPLDFVLRALRALRPCDPHHSDWIVC